MYTSKDIYIYIYIKIFHVRDFLQKYYYTSTKYIRKVLHIHDKRSPTTKTSHHLSEIDLK